MRSEGAGSPGRSLAALEARHGALPATIEAITDGGGRHVYFAHASREVRNRVGLAPGIDLRGDHGCIIVPPSVHPSGKRYRWKPGHAPGQVDLAELPVWLEQPRFSSDSPKGHSTTYWRELVHEGVMAASAIPRSPRSPGISCGMASIPTWCSS